MGHKLHDPNADLDPDILDREDPDVRWRADIWTTQVYLQELKVVRRTPKGMWLRGGGSLQEFWRSNNSKQAARTRREALVHLWHRKRSYLRHTERRLKGAYERELAVRNTLARVGIRTHNLKPQFERTDHWFREGATYLDE